MGTALHTGLQGPWVEGMLCGTLRGHQARLGQAAPPCCTPTRGTGNLSLSWPGLRPRWPRLTH